MDFEGEKVAAFSGGSWRIDDEGLLIVGGHGLSD
ncbi:hypothetical protein CASFOL_012020 [Castilleja foliolosa]|uniref:Uncharacterized protein n=1 Tax=Castilleja foliolosa TaxID=1961234 RepID=A0ABD3DPT2_9LAMI